MPGNISDSINILHGDCPCILNSWIIAHWRRKSTITLKYAMFRTFVLSVSQPTNAVVMYTVETCAFSRSWPSQIFQTKSFVLANDLHQKWAPSRRAFLLSGAPVVGQHFMSLGFSRLHVISHSDHQGIEVAELYTMIMSFRRSNTKKTATNSKTSVPDLLYAIGEEISLIFV